MMSSPLISVVVPNYNHARYLGERLDSVLNQTYTNLEVLLLDDCSPDNSRDILRQYAEKDERVHLIFNEQNSGSVFKQWKKGVAKVKGKYVWIAESDDYAAPDFLEKLLVVLESQPTTALAYCDSVIVDGTGRANGYMSTWKNERYHTKRWDASFCNSGQKELSFCLADNCTINNASAVLFRKSFLAQPDVINDTFRFAGDWMVYIKLASKHDIAYIPDRLNFYRDHLSNASKNAEKQGDIFFERTCCLLTAYEGLNDTVQKQIVFDKIVTSYIDVVNSALKINNNPSQFFNFAKKIAQYNYLLFTKLQALAVWRIGKILFHKR